jgi:ribosomal-protein-alanine N-acetyltransferase
MFGDTGNTLPGIDLSTHRLRLRQFKLSDEDSLYQLLTQGDVLRYFPNPNPPTPERVHHLIANQITHWGAHGYGWWAVQERLSGALLGWCGLQYLPETDEIEVGYLLGREYWGRGFATEAARASVDFGFNRLQLENIIALVHPQNKASIRVIEKLGMTFTGRFQYFGMEMLRYILKKSKNPLLHF